MFVVGNPFFPMLLALRSHLSAIPLGGVFQFPLMSIGIEDTQQLLVIEQTFNMHFTSEWYFKDVINDNRNLYFNRLEY